MATNLAATSATLRGNDGCGLVGPDASLGAESSEGAGVMQVLVVDLGRGAANALAADTETGGLVWEAGEEPDMLEVLSGVDAWLGEGAAARMSDYLTADERGGEAVTPRPDDAAPSSHLISTLYWEHILQHLEGLRADMSGMRQQLQKGKKAKRKVDGFENSSSEEDSDERLGKFQRARGAMAGAKLCASNLRNPKLPTERMERNMARALEVDRVNAHSAAVSGPRRPSARRHHGGGTLHVGSELEGRMEIGRRRAAVLEAD